MFTRMEPQEDSKAIRTHFSIQIFDQFFERNDLFVNKDPESLESKPNFSFEFEGFFLVGISVDDFFEISDCFDWLKLP